MARKTFLFCCSAHGMSVSDWSGHCETDPESGVRPHSPQSPESLPVNPGHYNSPRLTIVWAIIKEAVSIYTHTHDHAHHYANSTLYY